MTLIKLEELMKAAAYLQVRKEANRLLLEANLSVRDQGAVLRMACKASLALQEFYAAAKLGERAIEKARETGDIETLGRAHFDLGYAYTYIGDTYAAEQNLEEFLALLPKMKGMERGEGKALYNLSIIHQQRKQWHFAIQTLERASDLFKKNGQVKEQAQASLDIAWCYLMVGASHMAGSHLALVEAYLAQEPDESFEADLICEKALYFRLEGDIATSSHLCQEIFFPDRPGVTSYQLGEASWIMGENALDLGRQEEATLFVIMALDHAARANWPSLMNLAGDLRRRIAAQTAIGA